MGTREILSEFSTLYPYLSLIAYENKLSDPFDIRVVEAYWLGNKLLNIPKISFVRHLTDSIGLKKKLTRGKLNFILDKFKFDLLPHHSFHVLNIYKRTGHLDIPYTVKTMDACLVNWGRVVEILPDKLKIRTQRLKLLNDRLIWEENIERKIIPQGEKDKIFKKVIIGDLVSYHWGMLCQKLSTRQLNNIKYFTHLSLSAANHQFRL